MDVVLEPESCVEMPWTCDLISNDCKFVFGANLCPSFICWTIGVFSVDR